MPSGDGQDDACQPISVLNATHCTNKNGKFMSVLP